MILLVNPAFLSEVSNNSVMIHYETEEQLLKDATVDISIIILDQMTFCNIKQGDYYDEPTENY